MIIHLLAIAIRFNIIVFEFLDGRQIHVTVNVEPPMKQGQTRYHYMVLIFKVRKMFYNVLKELKYG